MMRSLRIQKESGAVSLFMVIFAMLIITVITVSFLRLMMVEQRQATDNELSQSAYDSAQAGVEDAKRALLRYQQICGTNPAACGALRSIIASNECNRAVAEGGIAVRDPSTGEVLVQQVAGVDSALNQAYTCVKIALETDDYIGSLAPGESKLVPLVGREDFNTVTIRWFSKDDVSNSAGTVSLQSAANPRSLMLQSNWPDNRPPIMRAQLIQFGSSFTMSDFDMTNAAGESNANTAFLYPTNGGSSSDSFTALDSRKNTPTGDPAPAASALAPRGTSCRTSVATTMYACEMSLQLPTPIGGGTSRTAFLRLTPFYNSTHFQVILSNGLPTVGLVQFKDVQPAIDSTGRANDVFRRVESRVDLINTNFPYPDATIDINGNFCKNFGVSDNPSTYTDSNTCTP